MEHLSILLDLIQMHNPDIESIGIAGKLAFFKGRIGEHISVPCADAQALGAKKGDLVAVICLSKGGDRPG